MASISVPTAIAISGGLGAVGSVASGVIGANAAQSAASTQAQAAYSAQQLQAQEFQETQANLAPFVQAGVTALPQLQALTGTNPGGNPLTARLTAPFNPTMAQLAATPGYQFTLGQGEQAVTNSFASQGLGGINYGNGVLSPSGAALKGAANYAEGLASTTYQQQFQNYLTQNQQIYNMLGGITGSGQNAAAGLGSLALQSAGQQGASLLAAGTASAAGTVGAANAITNALGGTGSTASNTALLLALNNACLFGGNPTSSGGGGIITPAQAQAAYS
jgi:hypothetical protein